MATSHASDQSTFISLAMPSKQWGILQKISKSSSVPFDVHRLFMKSDGVFPNNEMYSTLIYKCAFNESEREGRRMIAQSGHWTDPWVWGIFTYHHYHTKAWELLLCVRGSASIQLGGESGPLVTISKGDLVLIPPGVAHKQLSGHGGFSLLGSYPKQGFDDRIDTCTGKATVEELNRIKECYVVPEVDPIFNLEIKQYL